MLEFAYVVNVDHYFDLLVCTGSICLQVHVYRYDRVPGMAAVDLIQTRSRLT